jgi:uncharacterized repeat protein (TIGR01451 family)
MFKRLLSNLPFNPSLIGQVSLYAKQMRHEAILRRTGFTLLLLTVALQLFIAASPPQPSAASSNNDLINGGFVDKSRAVSICTQNTHNYKTILSSYSIACDDLERATTTSIHSTDYNKQLFVIGRLPYNKTNETPITIPDAGVMYARNLWAWDIGGPSNYKALKVTTGTHDTFFVLYESGNLILTNTPLPAARPQPKSPVALPLCQPKSKITNCSPPCEYDSHVSATNASCKPCTAAQSHDDIAACFVYHISVSNITQGISDANNTLAKPGDILRYTVTSTNHGKAVTTKYSTTLSASDIFDYGNTLQLNGATRDDHGVLTWPPTTIPAGATHADTFDVRIKSPLPSTPISSTDPGHYDLQMSTTYGNALTVYVPSTPIKTIEQISLLLQVIGPTWPLATMSVITLFAGYLFVRARIIAKELDIIRSDIGTAGGNS